MISGFANLSKELSDILSNLSNDGSVFMLLNLVAHHYFVPVRFVPQSWCAVGCWSVKHR
jgi:hypothetical protein